MDSKRVYQLVVGAVDHNTFNEVQGPTIPERAVRTVAGHGGADGEAISRALRAAVDNVDVVAIDRDGQTRFASIDEDQLQAVIDAELERDEPDRTVIARCNRGMAKARGRAVPQ